MKLSRLFRFKCFFIFYFSSLSLTIYCQQAKDTVLILYYKTGSFDLDSSQIESIFHFVSSVKSIREIAGYADTVGSLLYNRNLSRLRASQVYQLVSSRATIDSAYRFLGEEFSQESDLRLNRKVEIVGYNMPVNNEENTKKADGSLEKSTIARVEKIDSFEIRNINFMPDKPIITPESINAIPQLIQKIKSYKNAHFEIIGHVNYQSKRDEGFLQELYKLSEARAKVIYDILVSDGISDTLLKFRGAGNSLPLIKEPKNDQEKMKNMRVQILVYQIVSEY